MSHAHPALAALARVGKATDAAGESCYCLADLASRSHRCAMVYRCAADRYRSRLGRVRVGFTGRGDRPASEQPYVLECRPRDAGSPGHRCGRPCGQTRLLVEHGGVLLERRHGRSHRTRPLLLGSARRARHHRGVLGLPVTELWNTHRISQCSGKMQNHGLGRGCCLTVIVAGCSDRGGHDVSGTDSQ